MLTHTLNSPRLGINRYIQRAFFYKVEQAILIFHISYSKQLHHQIHRSQKLNINTTPEINSESIHHVLSRKRQPPPLVQQTTTAQYIQVTRSIIHLPKPPIMHSTQCLAFAITLLASFTMVLSAPAPVPEVDVRIVGSPCFGSSATGCHLTGGAVN